MFSMLPPVSSDFSATLYKRLLISPGFVNQTTIGRQYDKIKLLICNRKLTGLNLYLDSDYSNVYVIFSVPLGKFLKLGHDHFLPH